MRALYPYLPHATDPWGGEYPPGVYANGGSYAWLTCGAALALAWGGDAAAGGRVWSRLSSAMLFSPTPEHVAYEYLHSDTGARMGNAPQGWDGVCGAFAWLGGGRGGVHWWRDSPVWAWPPGGGAPSTEAEAAAPVDGALRVGERGVWHSHTYRLLLGSAADGSEAAPGWAQQELLLPLGSLPQGHFFRGVRGQDGGGEGLAGGWLLAGSARIVAGLRAAGSGGGGSDNSSEGFAFESSWECSRDKGGFPSCLQAAGTDCLLARRDSDRQAPSQADAEAAGGERYTCKLGVGLDVRVIVGALGQ